MWSAMVFWKAIVSMNVVDHGDLESTSFYECGRPWLFWKVIVSMTVVGHGDLESNSFYACGRP